MIVLTLWFHPFAVFTLYNRYWFCLIFGLERLEQDLQTRTESQTRLVEQVNASLRSGDYSRALDLLQGAAAEFPSDNDNDNDNNSDTELSELAKRAHEGVKRSAEANRLITKSQELFARQRPAEAIQLLREAYELDKKNSLSRAILANALVEQAHSFVETNWLEAETLTNQALNLNPAHPTAKTILGLIVVRKETSPVEDWVSQARKLQSSGDLFAALAWVAEGLAVHPHDPKLLQIQDEIQRDQDARRRQARRGDLEELRRLQREIDGASDLAAKQALAVRIQTLAAKHWTDGEILSIANALLLRLGLVSHESSGASLHGKGAAVIFHVPRASSPKASHTDAPLITPSQTEPNQTEPSQIAQSKVRPSEVRPSEVRQREVGPSIAPVLLVPTTPSKPQTAPPPNTTAAATELSTPAVQVTSSSEPEQPTEPEQRRGSNLTSLILVSAAAAIVAVAATLFFARKHYAPVVTKTSTSASASNTSGPAAFAANVSTAATPKLSSPALPVSSATGAGKVTRPEALTADDQPSAKPGHAVQVSNSGFQDPPQHPPQQEILARKGEQARVVSNLQPQTEPQPQSQSQPQAGMASLAIQGGVPGTTVFVDQTLVGTVQADGTLSVSTVNPGDHRVELRKERFKPRQFEEHFVAGTTISLAAADAALEAAPGELTITFAPADAKVAIVKGEHLTLVSSGVPLNLPAGTYTLTASTADGFRSSSTLEVIAGQSKSVDFSFAPSGMSKWDDPGAWKREKESFIRKGGDFVLYGVVPASGTFAFSAMTARGRLLQWVVNYTDAKNYVLFQMDDNTFCRTVIRNGEKTDEIKVPEKGDKKSFREFHIGVSPTELVFLIKHGDSWVVLDRLTHSGTDLSLGKFGFYIPGDDQITLSGFAHYPDLNLR
jgi:tetratricopeptide (TPR) repeat protein